MLRTPRKRETLPDVLDRSELRRVLGDLASWFHEWHTAEGRNWRETMSEDQAQSNVFRRGDHMLDQMKAGAL